MKNVVVLGAGFAGMYTAVNLMERLPKDCGLVIINKSSRFTFKPLLHEVAAGAFADDVVCEPISKIFRGRAEFIEGTARKIDLKEKVIHVNASRIPYEYLVIAIGSTFNDFGIPGAEKALKLQTLDDAFRIKSALIDAAKRQNPKIAVIGAGPTGSELSAEISSFMKSLGSKASIFLIDKNEPLLFSKEKLRQLVLKRFKKDGLNVISGVSCTKISGSTIHLDNSSSISADVIIWTAGVKPSSIELSPQIELPKGFFQADKFLRLKDCQNVFVAGDCAYVQNSDGKRVPMLAQSAEDEGKFIARNILASIRGKPLKKEYEFNSKGFIIALDRGYAVADIKGLIFSGFLAWLLNRTAYLMSMFGFGHKIYTAYQWAVGLFRRRR